MATARACGDAGGRAAARRLATMLLCLAPALAVPAAAGADATPRIALIIDDLGYGLTAARRAVRLPGPVACAVLPGSPRARQVAEIAAQHGKEVLLHLPLEAQDRALATEPGGIVLDMSRRQFARAFAASIEAVPHAVGVNSHRGSLLTRHPGHMRWLMEELGARDGLFFVDSYTTHHSVALRLASEAGVPAVKRDVFLDAERSAAGLEREFARLKRLARERGVALGIAHPYPETLAFLETALPRLEAEGLRLVTLRDLLGQAAGGGL